MCTHRCNNYIRHTIRCAHATCNFDAAMFDYYAGSWGNTAMCVSYVRTMCTVRARTYIATMYMYARGTCLNEASVDYILRCARSSGEQSYRRLWLIIIHVMQRLANSIHVCTSDPSPAASRIQTKSSFSMCMHNVTLRYVHTHAHHTY